MDSASNLVNIKTDRAYSLKRGRILEYFTIGWNCVEAIVAIVAGIFSGSTSLIGFGVDSVIESGSGIALLWRLQDGETGDNREKLALRLVGISFFFLAVYIVFDAGKSLLFFEAPEVSFVGIILAVFSVIIMPVLAYEKRKVAKSLNSRAMKADSRQTDICAYLSALLLVGLGLNAVFGWWWADSFAALLMVPIVVKEGVDAFRGEKCVDGNC